MAVTEQDKQAAKEGFFKLIEATSVKKPKAADLQALEKCFDVVPTLWRNVSMAHAAVITAIKEESESKQVQLVLEANYDGQLRELGYDKAPPLERALIEHAALCWLRLQNVEQRYSRVMAQSITLTMGDYWERRLSSAQRRYLRACETLARVRRLRLPALQVNIGENQVNVAGPVRDVGEVKGAKSD